MGTAVRTNAVPAWHRRRVRIYDREAPLGYLLLVPTLLVLGIFLLYPFLFGIWLSLTDSELGNLGSFIGLGNYRFEWRNTDGVFYTAVVNTFLYTGITTVFKLSLGLVMALLLNQAFPFRRFVRAALLLPYIIPTVLSYEAWRWMFDPTFSVINWLLVNTHLVAYPGPNWLGVPFNAMAALMIVNVWRGTPFYAIAFLAGMQVIPVDLYEAARVDGARRWQQFTNITIPLHRPVRPAWGDKAQGSQAEVRPHDRRQPGRPRHPHLHPAAPLAGGDAFSLLLDGGYVVQVGLRALRLLGQPAVGPGSDPCVVPAPLHSNEFPALGVEHSDRGDRLHAHLPLLQRPRRLLARTPALPRGRLDRLGNLRHLSGATHAALPAADLRHPRAPSVQQPVGTDPHVSDVLDPLLHLDADGLLQRHTA